MNAPLARFWNSGSPSRGAASGLIATPGRSGRSGESGAVERCWTWTTGHPAARHAARRRAMLASASGLLRRPYFGSSSPR